MLRRILFFVLVLILCTAGMARADLRFGVLAPRDSLDAVEVWRPLAQSLSESVGQRVSVVALGLRNVDTAAQNERVDIALVNAPHAVSLMDRQGYVPLASRLNATGGSYGGVIVASASSGIRTSNDLRGKRVAALGAESAGAFIFQVRHLMDRGIDPRMDFAEFKRCSGQAACVMAVKNGEADACFVRTGVLEALAQQGAISLDDFVIVDARCEPGFPLAHSTDLYPEWYLLVSNNVDTSTRERLRDAAFSITQDDPAAAPSRTRGFETPRDIEPVRSALQSVFAAGFADLP